MTKEVTADQSWRPVQSSRGRDIWFIGKLDHDLVRAKSVANTRGDKESADVGLRPHTLRQVSTTLPKIS